MHGPGPKTLNQGDAGAVRGHWASGLRLAAGIGEPSKPVKPASSAGCLCVRKSLALGAPHTPKATSVLFETSGTVMPNFQFRTLTVPHYAVFRY